MIDRPINRLRPICYYTGLVILVLNALQILPILTSVAYGEWPIALAFVASLSIAALVAAGLMLAGAKERFTKLSFGEGMVVAAGSWFFCMLLAALPYYFSGNYLSYLDTCFDVMSGLTTTGLSLIQDMDHISNGINMWRFILTYVGGQGMVVLALTFLTKGQGGAYRMYVGEAKDEKLFPNAISTAKRIWQISLIYLAIGTVVLTLSALAAGMRLDRAFLHGLWMNMSAWSTGGFAPMSQSVLYYHSSLFELATVVFFVIGSFNFALHHAVLSGNTRELRKNIETVTFSVTLIITVLLCTLGLMKEGVYPDAMAMFRKGFYQLISGHTTTGFMTIYAKQFYYEWGDIALFAITIAMMFGGSASSTAGGFKGIRTGILFTALRSEVRRMVLPESRVKEILYKRGLAQFTEHTLIAPADFFGELAETKRRGWAIDDEERNLGMRCVAGAIFNEYGEAIAGVSVSGPTVRVTRERLSELGPLVRRAADEITTSIGGRPPRRG